MGDVPDRFQPWEQREGLVPIGVLPMADAVRAVVASLGTARHARRFVDAVVWLLAERAYEDPSAAEGHRWIFVRDPQDPELIAPVPVVTLAPGRSSVVFAQVRITNAVEPLGAPEPGPPTSRIQPTGEGMTPCELRLSEGRAHLELVYGEHGVLTDTGQSAADPWTSTRYPFLRPYTIDPQARPPTPRPMSVLCRADLSVEGHSEEDLAAMLLDGVDDRLGALRVRIRKPIPGGVRAAAATGLRATRKALFEGRPGEAGGVIVADGYDGSACVIGADREEALRLFEGELFRVKPRPPGAAEETPKGETPKGETRKGETPKGERLPPEKPEVFRDEEGKVTGFSTGTMSIQMPSTTRLDRWPAAVPANIPAVVLPFGPLPQEIPQAYAAAGFDRWVRLVGEAGEVRHALIREDEAVSVLVGEGVLDIVDPEGLVEELDAADAETMALLSRGSDGGRMAREAGSSFTTYRVFDNGRRGRVPAELAGARHGEAVVPWDGGSMDELAWQAARWRRGT